MTQRTPYDNLPLLPRVLAETVAGTPYAAIEYSDRNRPASLVAKTEQRRQAMTPDMVRQFADACDHLCRSAYAVRAAWFERIARAKDSRCRDQLAVWMSHWLSGYLDSPEQFLRHIAQSCGPRLD